MKRLKAVIKVIGGLTIGLISFWALMVIGFILFAIVTLPIWVTIWFLWQL